MLFVPRKGEQRWPFGHAPEDSPTGTYHYTCAHGTDLPTAGKIRLEDLCRPTSIRDTFGDGCREIPACVVYGRATPGEISEHTIHAVADQATRRSKGQQGILVIGTISSRFQHYRIEYRDMCPSLSAAKGVVRTPDKWGFHAGHFSIVGFGIIC